jgi:type IV pilus assembly protein PilE
MRTIHRSTLQHGVTLVELLTVLIAIAVLAAIAIPSYSSYLLRTRRSDATAALLQVQAAQAKFYLQNNAYARSLTDPPPGGLGMPATTTHGYYALEVQTAANGQSYIAIASPAPGGGQTDDTKCGSFTLADTGTRNATGTSGAATCWK